MLFNICMKFEVLSMAMAPSSTTIYNSVQEVVGSLTLPEFATGLSEGEQE